MMHFGKGNSLFIDYLKILGVEPTEPSLDLLKQLTSGHLRHIPFENISKIYYKLKYGLRDIPDFELYINGIKNNNFGGTCYSNNYYFNLLLKYLGFDAILCGADMKNPDVHFVNIITIKNREYIVDVGYAAPFFEPVPRNISTEYIVSMGNDKYVFHPPDDNDKTRMHFYRNGELKHGYTVKPKSRMLMEFGNVIDDSFNDKATFMNSLLIVLFGKDSSSVIHNYSVIEYKDNKYEKRNCSDKILLSNEIEKLFGIPKEIAKDAVNHLTFEGDAWS